MHLAIALGHSGAAFAIQPDGMHLVEVGHGAIPLGHVADRRDRADVRIY
jgi:hypothetical protein